MLLQGFSGMNWGLLIKEGPHKGKLFKIADGLVIGRSKVDISLGDPHVSSKHAKIIEAKPDQFIIKDQQSSNGTWVEGQSVKEIELKEGLEVHMGDSILRIVDMDEMSLTEAIPSDWRSGLSMALKKLSSKIQKKENPIQPLASPMRIDFIGGVQLDTKWYLGYGPRKVGSKVPDLRILDTKAPEICFQITPRGESAVTFETEHPQTVTLNGLHVSSKTLEDGDVIEINTSDSLTKMRVTFV